MRRLCDKPFVATLGPSGVVKICHLTHFFMSGCTGPPDLSAYRKWNRGGMFDFESSNGMGWKGGNWPPR